MLNIKKLYLKKVTKEIVCSEEQKEFFRKHYIDVNKSENLWDADRLKDIKEWNDFLNENEDQRKRFNEETERFVVINTKRSYQLVKLSSFPFIDQLVRANWEKIDILNKPLLFSQEQYNIILEKSNLSKEVDQILVFIDNDNIFCIIMPTTEEMLKTINKVDEIINENKFEV